MVGQIAGILDLSPSQFHASLTGFSTAHTACWQAAEDLSTSARKVKDLRRGLTDSGPPAKDRMPSFACLMPIAVAVCTRSAALCECGILSIYIERISATTHAPDVKVMASRQTISSTEQWLYAVLHYFS